jgi:hypothetical protein
MKQKIILSASLLFLIVLIIVMSKDLFFTNNEGTNLYEYNVDKFKNVDSNMLCYKELGQIKPGDSKLYGIAIDEKNNVLITTENRVIINNENGDSIFSFKIADNAGCIAAGPNGMIFLGYKKHLEVYTNEGKQVKKWNDITGAPYITSISVNDSSVFVADAGNKLVHHFNYQGKLVNEIGKKDPEKGIPGLFIPSPYFDVLMGKNNEIWVINTGRHSFESYTKEGELVTSFTKTSMTFEGFSGCCNPTHVAMLSDGSFVTSEKGIERVKIHSASGEFKCMVAASDQFIAGTTGLDIAVNSKDQIYILDPFKKMIRIFDKK